MRRTSDIPLLALVTIVAASSAGIGFIFGQHAPLQGAPAMTAPQVSREMRTEESDLPYNEPDWTEFKLPAWNLYFEYPDACEIEFMPMVDGLYLSPPEGVPERLCPFFGVIRYDATEGYTPSRELLEIAESLNDSERFDLDGSPALSGTFINEHTSTESANTYIVHDGHVYLLYYEPVDEGQAILDRMTASVGFPDE